MYQKVVPATAAPQLPRRPPAFDLTMFAGASLAMLGTLYVYDSIGPVASLLTRDLHFSDVEIGTLNAIYSVPNIFMGLVGGLLIDRWGVRVVVFWTALLCLAGALLTSALPSFPLMVAGRLLFGLGAETLMVGVLVAMAQWFSGRSFALLLALNISLGRLGSYLADRSPSFAHTLYEHGWRPPLLLAVVMSALAFLGVVLYVRVDRRATDLGLLARAPLQERFVWRSILRFRASYWLLLAICVAFYSVIVPFRSTFAIKFFQNAHGLTLEDASRMNSYVYMAAIFAMPAFGWCVDRFGHHALLMIAGSVLLPLAFLLMADATVDLWLPTALLGLSYSLIPAVLWPLVPEFAPNHQGTAYGLMVVLQNTGLALSNIIAGVLNDSRVAGAQNPQGYAAMLVYFGVLSLAACLLSVMLALSSRRRLAAPTGA